ncbi:MAG TPA: PDZ domain-containing protein, partial [Sphingomonas sp.]
TGQGGAYDRFIQTDASINQGNSGGPMFDLNGNVIGINSQIFSQSGGNIGIGFAIPAEQAKPIIDTFMKGGKIARGYIGVGIGGPVDDDAAAALGIPKNQGELISRVEPAGPAAKAGLRAGDVVTKVNGQAVTPDQTLSYLVSNVKPGSTARLDVIRNNQSQVLNITVATRPSEEQLAATVNGGDDAGGFGGDDDDATGGSDGAVVPTSGNALGLNVQPLTPGIARAVGVDAAVQGVVIATVDPASDANGKLKRGDVIQAINGTPVRTSADVGRVVAQAKSAGRPQVLLLVQRGRNAPGFLAVKLKG